MGFGFGCWTGQPHRTLILLEAHAARDGGDHSTPSRSGNRSSSGGSATRLSPSGSLTGLPTIFLLFTQKAARAARPIHSIQPINLLRRTLLTSPSIMKFESTLEPPALISGNGMPVTGIRPTTIPTFTNM